jgi:hypothetical protein
MENIDELITAIEKYIPHAEKINKFVSEASVGWHLAHSLMVIESTVKALQQSNPDEYKSQFSKWKFIIFLTKKIPSGRAKAPEIVLPKEIFSTTDLATKAQQVKSLVPILNQLPKNAYFKHPFFKHLNVKDAKKNMVIHTKHHLKIVQDILKTV